jgi:PIN domain nuclease of toxin-antitoxin system
MDTHALVWWLSDDPALTRRARRFISAAATWEIATKVRLGKVRSATDLAGNFQVYLEREGFELLSISPDHAVHAGLLPGLHKDPFDRMLIAQAQAEGIPLLVVIWCLTTTVCDASGSCFLL